MVLSPKRLWETYDRSLLPLEVSEIARKQTENGTERRLYFNGEATALGCTRIFARLIASAQKTEKLIIILPEPEQDVCAADFSFLSDNGWDILIVDHAGNAFDHARYTIYPSALSFSDYNAQSLYKPVENPQKSCWYIWTTVALRAVTFAQSEGYTRVAMCGFGSGGASVLKTAAVTDYPVCALTFFSPGFFPESEDPELLGTNISMDVRGYAPLLKIPLLQLCCSNDTDASLNEINEFTEQAAQSSQKAALYIAPRVNKSLPKEMTANAVAFLSAYLSGDNPPDIHA
ncbi:MAG: hypothetical protein K2L51_06020, partial [Clostridiales bacterium]|nr:hypothetical protein [Clostridiales bacterium]